MPPPPQENNSTSGGAYAGFVRYDRYDADQLQTPVLPGISSAAYNVWGWNFGASISSC